MNPSSKSGNILAPIVRMPIVRKALRTLKSPKDKREEVFIIVVDKYRAIYFLIPKVACSSLKAFCADLLNINIPEKHTPHKIKFPYLSKADISNYQNYFKFCFVRNPWDRVVSCYRSKIKTKEDLTYNKEDIVNGVYRNFIKYGLFRADMPFDEFVQAIASIPDADADPHFASQYTFVTGVNGNLLVDYVGKLENVEQDFADVCEALKISNYSLPHLAKSPRTTYKDYYTQDLIEIVGQRYAKDIEIFDYHF